MEDDIKQKIAQANDLRHVLPQLLGVEESLVVLRLLGADDTALGELWIANGSKIVQASARTSASFGYLAALELLACKPQRFEVDTAKRELMADAIDISLEDLITDESTAVQAIKSILWPIEEPTGPLSVAVRETAARGAEDISTADVEVIPDALPNDGGSAVSKENAFAEPTSELAALLLAQPEGELDDLQTKMKDAVETAALFTDLSDHNDFQTAGDKALGTDQPDDQLHTRLEQYEQLKETSENKEVFYSASSPELDPAQDKTSDIQRTDLEAVKLTQTPADASVFAEHDPTLGSDEMLYPTLDTAAPIIDGGAQGIEAANRETSPPPPGDGSGTGRTNDDRRARVDTGTWRTLKSFDEPLTEASDLVNRTVTANHEIASLRLPRAKRLDVSKPVAVSILAAALALPIGGFFLVQFINYERKIDQAQGAAAAYQTDRSMDDESLATQLQEPFRLPAAPASGVAGPSAGSYDGGAPGADDNNAGEAKAKVLASIKQGRLALGASKLSLKQPAERGYEPPKKADYGDQVTLWSAEVRRSPNDLSARRNLAHALALNGNDEAAVQQFSALNTLKPLDLADSVTYGQVLERSGHKEMAIQIFENCLQTDPHCSEARQALIAIYQAAGFNDKVAGLCKDGYDCARTDSDRAFWRNLSEHPTAAAPAPSPPPNSKIRMRMTTGTGEPPH